MNKMQRWLLIGIGFISIVSTIRLQLLTVGPLPGVPLEFYTLTLSLPDALLIALLAATGWRSVTDRAYRSHLWTTCQTLWRRGSLLLWFFFIGWMGASTAWALEPLLTRFVTLQAAAGVVLAIIVADRVRQEGHLWLMWGLLASAVIQTGIASAQVLNNNTLGLAFLGEIPPHPFDQLAYFRPPGLSHNPNYLGGYLMLAITAGLTLFACAGQVRARWWALLAAIFCAFGLILTLSRGTFIGVAIAALTVVVALSWRASPRRRWQVVAGLIVFTMVGTALVAVVTRGDLVGRFFGARDFFVADAWRVIQANPLLGSGAGNLMYTISLRLGVIDSLVLPVHVVYLYLWAESGLVGLILFLSAYISAFRGWQPQRWVKGTTPDTLLWGAALIGIMVTMAFDNYWWAIHPFRVLFFWVFGAWYGLRLRRQSESAATTAPDFTPMPLPLQSP